MNVLKALCIFNVLCCNNAKLYIMYIYIHETWSKLNYIRPDPKHALSKNFYQPNKSEALICRR